MSFRRGIFALAFFVSQSASAATLTVGPGKTFAKPCAAIAAAQPGDIIEVDASGNYDGDTCAWSTDNLTVRGVGGRAKIDLTGVTPAQQKGIFTVYAPNATIENFELSGAAISANAGNNGAGIRHQGTNLTVRNCYLHDDQDGILGAPPTDGTGTVLIEYSEFANNGAGDGYSHNMYLNHYASFTLRYSYSHGAKVGHLVKTRAYENFVLYNRITDETGTTASYEIDIPNGGTSYVIGNLIEQSATSQNPTIVTSGEEGTSNPDQHFYFVNNTVVNDLGSGTFVNLAAGTIALLENDIFRGKGTITSLAGATLTSNWDDGKGDPMLAAQASYDYHLLPGSPCVDQGTAPGSGLNNQSLAPDHDYVDVASTETRSVAGAAIDIGAYELGGGGTDAGTTGDAAGGSDAASGSDAAPGGDGGTGGEGGSGGCGCTTAGGAGNTLAPWVALGALAGLIRRRRSPSSARARR
ncbi:MAG TPA: choice-of-anchor Q domain-containing protein [Polyangiaceae bacterium]|nr:choice-of-anchor Q domain-containing protein [Polyangiaceae bacterium]